MLSRSLRHALINKTSLSMQRYSPRLTETLACTDQ